jgi:hypothetical protein
VLFQTPVLDVVVCSVVSRLTQRTLEPCLTVTVCGLNAKFLIVTIFVVTVGEEGSADMACGMAIATPEPTTAPAAATRNPTVILRVTCILISRSLLAVVTAAFRPATARMLFPPHGSGAPSRGLGPRAAPYGWPHLEPERTALHSETGIGEYMTYYRSTRRGLRAERTVCTTEPEQAVGQ